MLSSVDCITTTSESEFSVHTGHRHRCLLGNNVRDHATILPDDATPKPDGIFGKDSGIKVVGIAPSMRVPENTACAVGVETPAKCNSVACILASLSEKAGNKATKRKMIGIRFLSCNLADVCLYENL